MVEQPSGTVTLVFTDIEGSTRLLRELGQDRYRDALAEHRQIVREAFAEGYEVDYEGDAFFYAFASAPAAVAAVAQAQRELKEGPIRIRVGLHTGTPALDPPKYVGEDVHLAARIMSAGHGGQVLVSRPTRELVEIESTGLGEHRLKDFDAPVSLYQLGSERFPPLKTISNTNLPRPVSSLVGREAEIAEVAALVRPSRLVTLTGPGGAGKTRLSVEAAAELVGEFKAGVFWIGLATLRDPALVVETIAQVLGAKDDLAGLIGERELLLLLDNFEQVVDAAPQLSALLSACLNLHVLVTSRELLRIDGEVEYAVPPLASDEAVELFCARAALKPSEDVRELCRRLDDMPLAVELAAARTSVLSPAQILERLSQRLDLLKGGRDKDPRQQTLRATIQWSYDLLSEEEQELFACLAVFEGGCTLEAAEEVCAADLDVLQSLVDKSLVRHSGERFWMLETIRELAAELRRSSGREAELDQLHQSFFMNLAREAEVGERGPDQAVWWRRLEDEVDNMRAALDRARARGEHLQELELAALLKRFWHVRSRLHEGRRRIEEALAAAGGADGALRARALAALSMLICRTSGDMGAAAELTEDALQFYSEIGDEAGVARMTLDLGATADLGGDRPRARTLYEQARKLARKVGDRRYEYFGAHNLANLAFQGAEYPLAVDLGTEAVETARATGDPGNVQSATLLLAYILAGAGRALEARDMGVGVLRATASSGVQWVSRDALDLLAITEIELGMPERGATFAGLAERLRAESGEPREPSGERLYRPAVEEAAGILGVERFEEELARGARLTLEDAVDAALDGARSGFGSGGGGGRI
jgi:predicted ATPase